MNTASLTFHVEAWRVDARGRFARWKNAEVALATDLDSVLRRKETQT